MHNVFSFCQMTNFAQCMLAATLCGPACICGATAQFNNQRDLGAQSCRCRPSRVFAMHRLQSTMGHGQSGADQMTPPWRPRLNNGMQQSLRNCWTDVSSILKCIIWLELEHEGCTGLCTLASTTLLISLHGQIMDIITSNCSAFHY